MSADSSFNVVNEDDEDVGSDGNELLWLDVDRKDVSDLLDDFSRVFMVLMTSLDDEWTVTLAGTDETSVGGCVAFADNTTLSLYINKRSGFAMISFGLLN